LRSWARSARALSTACHKTAGVPGRGLCSGTCSADDISVDLSTGGGSPGRAPQRLTCQPTPVLGGTPSAASEPLAGPRVRQVLPRAAWRLGTDAAAQRLCCVRSNRRPPDWPTVKPGGVRSRPLGPRDSVATPSTGCGVVMTTFIEQGSVVVGTVRSAGSIAALEHPLALSESVAGFGEKYPDVHVTRFTPTIRLFKRWWSSPRAPRLWSSGPGA